MLKARSMHQSMTVMADNPKFEGYKWKGLLSHNDESAYGQWARKFLDRINWDALCEYASRLYNDENCKISPAVHDGGTPHGPPDLLRTWHQMDRKGPHYYDLERERRESLAPERSRLYPIGERAN